MTSDRTKIQILGIMIILLLLLTITVGFHRFNLNEEVTGICDIQCVKTPMPEPNPIPKPKNNTPPPIKVTPKDGGNSPTPIIASTTLFDYNQDGQKTLRLILTMNNPNFIITDSLYAFYADPDNIPDWNNITEEKLGEYVIRIPLSNINGTYGPQGTYLVSIPNITLNVTDPTGPPIATPLNTVGSPNTYRYFLVFGEEGMSGGSSYPFDRGTGLESDPFVIQDIVQLDALRYYTTTNGSGKYFEIVENISFPTEWNNNTGNAHNRALSNGNGWISIGGNKGASPVNNDTNAFRGNLNGNNKTLSNFIIKSDAFSEGLFGSVGGNDTQRTEIKNLKINHLTMNNVTTSSSYVGALSGHANYINITNVDVTALTLNGFTRVGGLVGYVNHSKIENSNVSGTITTTNYATGGLIGSASNSQINHSNSTTNIVSERLTGTNTSGTGGLVGVMTNVNIDNSNHIGTLKGFDSTGGLVGAALGENIKMNNSTHTGNIEGWNNTGGLIGLIQSGSNYSIGLSHATGDLFISSHINPTGGVGGIIGKDLIPNGTMDNCHYKGNISFAQDVEISQNIGGLVGFIADQNTTIKNSSAEIEIVVDKGKNVGGLVGHAFYKNYHIENCTAFGNISTTSNPDSLLSTAGGIGGKLNNTTIVNSSSSVNINGISNSSEKAKYGGLIGESSSQTQVIRSYSTGNIYGNEDNVGGLIGASAGDTIQDSYATGNIIGKTFVGGLVGEMKEQDSSGTRPAAIKNSYASGNVSATNMQAGLVGSIGNNTTLENCVALNTAINGSNTHRIYDLKATGSGIVLTNNYAYEGMTGTISQFSDKTSSGRDGSDVSAANAKTQAFYSGTLTWNFGPTGPVWKMGNTAYPLPVLSWQDESTYPKNPPAWMN
ncbi:GLUG motif-containing protein [Methanolapillus ohkumae]|uniref:GLUG domain-containing protein n=1 Tax=Methanolapillus ohkumae TaxID=3028298 RepID=A0AA96V5L4_9EURY|nr:hypothetical protein MsAm2_03300 [Methanosarcinaceae archaeon Am2]